MNLSNTFFNRDQSIATVNMAMNYLSRLVRENMTIYDYDSKSGTAAFLTDSDQLVKCVVVKEGSNVSLKDIEVDSASDVFSDKRIDNAVGDHVSSFIGSLREGSFGGAEQSFNELLGAFESRSRVTEARAKLERRRGHFGDSQNIVDTPEFTKLTEVKEQIVDYLKENKDTLVQYEDVLNSVKLTNALGKAFNLSKKTLEEVVETGNLDVPYDSKKTVFEMVCTQELIRSELTESKENFARSWVKNSQISKLASCIYNDDAVVQNALKEAVAAVPYLALASKSDIKTVFASIYESSDVANISQKDVREYVARIFEFKKPIKQSIISELNESYGINVQNLKFVPTFANLAKAQSVLFEALAKIGEKETVVRDVFVETAKCLRKKNGIQTLDLNDFIKNVFDEAGLHENSDYFRAMDLDSVVENVFENKDKGYPEKGIKGGTKAAKEEEDKMKDKKPLKGDQDELDADKDGDIEADDLKDLRKNGKNGKDDKKKKKKKNGEGDKEAEAASEDSDAFDESVQHAEAEEEQDLGSGLSDEQMTGLMGELDDLFKEIDWDALGVDEEDVEMSGGEDYSDEATERTPNNFSDEEVGSPQEDEAP